MGGQNTGSLVLAFLGGVLFFFWFFTFSATWNRISARRLRRKADRLREYAASRPLSYEERTLIAEAVRHLDVSAEVREEAYVRATGRLP